MLTGRDTELQRLLAAISRDRSAAVLGPSGVGKTALAAALAGTLDPSRYFVVRAVGTEASRSVPFGALAELVMGGDEPPDQAFLMARIAREAARRAGGRAAVLVVDDAHLLDGPSAGAVLALAAGRRARAVVTIRAGEPMPDAIRALWKDHDADRIELAPFDRAGTELLLAELLGGVVAGPTVDLLYQWTGGNPLFLTELVRAGRSDDRLRIQAGIWWWHSDLTVPARLAELLDRRVDGLRSDERDAVAAVALGEPLAIELLDAVGSAAVTARLEDLAIIRTEETASGVTARL
ncbi:MAG TPA: AAA family ATPase, partial [Jatrophihabitans sp.]|nr:AAA family ATPase [Jatrophihabitans sp.]